MTGEMPAGERQCIVQNRCSSNFKYDFIVINTKKCMYLKSSIITGLQIKVTAFVLNYFLSVICPTCFALPCASPETNHLEASALVTINKEAAVTSRSPSRRTVTCSCKEKGPACKVHLGVKEGRTRYIWLTPRLQLHFHK